LVQVVHSSWLIGKPKNQNSKTKFKIKLKMAQGLNVGKCIIDPMADLGYGIMAIVDVIESGFTKERVGQSMIKIEKLNREVVL